MSKFFFLSIAGCVLLPSVAFAAPDQPRSERVSYADLNITSAAGQKILNHRLARAASVVCEEPSGELFAQLNADRCRRQALAQARLHMNQAVAYALQAKQGDAVLLASR